MAEERTLGLARAQDQTAEEPSKEELQRRLDHTRDSISQTVTEIKETVANQVQAVKNTLDWREQFKKRPVAWSAGAIGVGFLVGYGVGSAFKGDDEYQRYSSAIERYGDESRSYAAQPILGTSHGEMGVPSMAPRAGNGSRCDVHARHDLRARWFAGRSRQEHPGARGASAHRVLDRDREALLVHRPARRLDR